MTGNTRVTPKKSKVKKILIVATEATPYVTVGGFASVVGYLSRELATLGCDVRIFIPKFGFIDEKKFHIKTVYEGLHVPTGDEKFPELICNVKTAVDPVSNIITYFLENHEYYEKRANVYGYSDDPTRWALLSKGVLEFIRTGLFVPDVLHCNDWHTGIVANYMKTTCAKDPCFEHMATVFTIHNLSYQGMFNHKYISELDYDDGKSAISSFFSPRLNKLNFMRRGILYADAINTVSKTYSKEILTSEYGEGLDKLLLELRGKLFGIINGIDYTEFDPSTDSLIEKNYDINSLDVRIENKRALQKEFDLPVKDKTLLLGFVGRLDFMKGVDLLVSTMHHVLEDFDVQFVEVGGGDGSIVELLKELKKSYPDKVGVNPYPNFTLPRLVFAGADCMLYPSRFEPCGIVQLEALRYGAIPIVRKVGGLADTVTNFDSEHGSGTGFIFDTFSEFSLFGQIVRAYEVFKNKSLWDTLQKNAMACDFSWKHSAVEYLKLYEKACLLRNKKHPRDKDV